MDKKLNVTYRVPPFNFCKRFVVKGVGRSENLKYKMKASDMILCRI
jgi:hypothetical protein